MFSYAIISYFIQGTTYICWCKWKKSLTFTICVKLDTKTSMFYKNLNFWSALGFKRACLSVVMQNKSLALSLWWFGPYLHILHYRLTIIQLFSECSTTSSSTLSSGTLTNGTRATITTVQILKWQLSVVTIVTPTAGPVSTAVQNLPRFR